MESTLHSWKFNINLQIQHKNRIKEGKIIYTWRTQFSKEWLIGGILDVNSWTLMTLATHLNWGIDGLDYTADISGLTYQLDDYDNSKDLFAKQKLK